VGPPQRLSGLPIITGLLAPSLHEPGPLGAAGGPAQIWPNAYADLETVAEALA
jgi:hypothetical protein